VHTVGGTCAHALSVFCLPAFVHCINIQKSTRYRALPSDEIEKKWDLEFITVWCKEFGGWKASSNFPKGGRANGKYWELVHVSAKTVFNTHAKLPKNMLFNIFCKILYTSFFTFQ